MIKNIGWIAGIFVLALICMAGAVAAQEDTGTNTDGTVIIDDIKPYDGPVGPESPLYGLKIAFEDFDESFTANETERFTMQVNTSRLRLSEVQRELLRNNTDAANRALDLYEQKNERTQRQLQNSTISNATSLLHAQEMILNHQFVLENLLKTHPGNQGLMRAYNNTISLEQKFQEKTQTRFERVMERNNATIVKAFRFEVRQQGYARNTSQNQTLQLQQIRQVQQGAGNGMDDSNRQGRVITNLSSPGQQQVKTNATIAAVRTITGPHERYQDRENTGTGNTSNFHGNSGRNSDTNPAPETGSGKNR